MDPLTQASLGAAAAALFSRGRNVRRAIIVGATAGAAPDVDVLIRSATDPLLALEYHRHFTHALLFAPVIGLLVAALFKGLFFWKRWPYRELALFGVVGALTHGLLDACTSYGTLLYLPISSHRESWDIISIIDPIFTLPLFLLTVCAFAWRRPQFARVVFGFCMLYLCFGMYQRERAQDFALSLAEERGHQPLQLTARPSFGNTVLWRLVYRQGDQYYVDAVRILPFRPAIHYPGASVPAFKPEDTHELLPAESTLARDVERFRFFSQGYLYQVPSEPVVADLRYSMFPDSVEPLWGIMVMPQAAEDHAEMVYFRDPSQRSFDRLWRMIQGESAEL